MSTCPSLSLSCDNLSCNIWFCCGSTKDPDQHDDAYLPTKQQQPPPPPQYHPPPTQPPPSVVTVPGYAPPSDLVPPHQVPPAPAPKPAVATPHGPVPPCCNKAHEPLTTTSPATLPSKRHEPARTVTPRAPVEAREPPATIVAAVVPSKRYEQPQPAWKEVAPRATVPPQPVWTVNPRRPVQPNEPPPPVRPPPARVASKKHETPPQPSAHTTWPPHVPSNRYDGPAAVSTMRPPVPHRIYDEIPTPAVTPPQPATSTASRVRASQYPPAHHPQHDDTSFRVESYSQAHKEEYY